MRLTHPFFSLRRAWRWTPGSLSLVLLFQIALAFLPALQVWALAGLVASYEAVPNSRGLWLLATAIVTGAVIPLQDVLKSATNRMQSRLSFRYRSELTFAAAALSPSQRSTPSVADELHATREAVPFNLAWQATSALTVMQAFLTAIALCYALAFVSPLAAILATLALVPTLVAYQATARIENEAWPRLSADARIAEYYENQLIYTRSGTELAAVNGSHQFAQWATDRYQRVSSEWDLLYTRELRSMLLSSLATVGLLAGALFSLLANPSIPASGAVGAVMGCVSGLLATRGAGAAFGELMSSIPLIEAYQRLVPCLAEPTTTAGPSDARGVTCRAVHYRYPGRELFALAGVDLEAAVGQVVAVVGPNGAGKSTLVKAICGVLSPDSGEIIRVGDARRDTAVMFQDPTKFELTVRELLTLGLVGPVPDKQLWAALATVGLGDFFAGLAGGLDTQLGEQRGGVDLSGGQWPRLALGRVVLSNAPVWVLDEPTSGIDAQAEAGVLERVFSSGRDRVILLVSHHAWTLKSADVIYVMRAGRVVQRGSFAELTHGPGPFLELFQEQRLTVPD